MRSRLFQALRFFATLALVAYVLAIVDWTETARLLSRTNPLFLLLSFAISPLLVFVSAWKWWILLKARHKGLSLGRLFNLYMVGYFFNNVLPSNVGGDVIRGYEAGRQIGDKATALASVFVERFTGVTALILVAAASLVSNLGLFGDWRFSVATASAVVGYGLVLVFLVARRPMDRLAGRFPGARVARLTAKIEKLRSAIRGYRDHRRQLWWAMALSVVFYALAVVNVYISSLAFGTLVPLMTLVVIVPIILVISMIPISLGGIGLQEWAYFFTFGAVGAGGSLGFLVAALMRLKGILLGVVGGVLYMVMKTGRESVSELRSGSVPTGEVDPATLGFTAVLEDRRHSALQKYRMLHVGRRGWLELAWYELVTLLAGGVPGLLGIFLRQKLYRSLFRRMGRGVVLGRGLLLRQPDRISLGNRTVIDDYCLLTVRGEGGGITVGDGVFIGRCSVLSARGGTIEIRDQANLSSHVRVGSAARVVIGERTLVAAFCYIGGTDHRTDRTDIPIARQGSISKGGTMIEEDVWLGAGVIVNDGVRVGKGSVIGAGAVVTRDLPPYSVAFGVPARVVRNRGASPEGAPDPGAPGADAL